MKQKLPAILITLLLLSTAIILIVWRINPPVAAGDETWSELAICPQGVSDQTVIPEDFLSLMKELESALASELIAERVADQFESIMPRRTCLQQIGMIKLGESADDSNRVLISMATDNPLVGAAVLDEVLLRAEREFLSRTSRLGTEQEDLIKLQNKQIEFQSRIIATQQELNTLVSTSSQNSIDKAKIDSMRSELGQLEDTDRMMTQQLKELEAIGEGMTFQSPTLEMHVTQAPTFDRVSYLQLLDYSVLQKENRSLLSPLTPAMQNALSGKTGFTVH